MQNEKFSRSATLDELNHLKTELAGLKAAGAPREQINQVGAKIAAKEYALNWADGRQLDYVMDVTSQ